MPKYRNDTDKTLKIDIHYVKPGTIVATPFYFYISGLTKIDDRPFCFNPAVYYSKKYGNENDICDIDVPKELWKEYKIRLAVLKGACELRFNSVENNPPMILRRNAVYKKTIPDGRRVDSLKIKFIEHSSEIEVMINKA